MTPDLDDAYIVLDTSPRFRYVVLVTFDRNEAEAAKAQDTDRQIVQKSGKHYPDSWT